MALPPPENLDPNVVALTRALRTIESGGNYSKKGASGEIGSAYQWLPSTWKEHAGKVLGDPNAALTPENQNYVAYHKVKEFKDQGLTPDQILSKWNSGDTRYEGKVGVNSSGQKYDVPAYVDRGLSEYQEEVAKLGGSFGGVSQNQTLPDEAGQPELPGQKSVGGFLGNVFKSGGRLLGGAGSAIANPVDTVRGLADISQGAVQKLIPGEQGKEQNFDAVAGFYKDRYGGAENIKKTLYEDPVGASADASVLLGGAGAIVGGVGKVAEASELTRLGAGLTKASQVVDPIQAIGKGVGAARTGVGSLGTKVGDALTPIDQGVVNTLRPQNVSPGMSLAEQATSKQKNLGDLSKYLEQAKKSVSNYSEDNALKLASGKAEDALANMDKQLKLYGKTKEMALERIASKPVNASNLKDTFVSTVQQRTGAKFTKGGVLTTPRGQFSTISSAADRGLLTDTYMILNKLGDNPTAARADRAVDALQARLNYASKNLYEPVNSQIEALVKETVKDLNTRLQSIDDNYRLANKGYSDTVEIRNELNKALGLHSNKGASLLKRVFSLTDGGTKALFDKIKDRTGVDLIREATLAKFAMESVGDYRQSNLLEQLLNAGKVPTDTRGLVGKAAEFVLDKAVERNPGNKALRMLGGKPAPEPIGRFRQLLNRTGKSITPVAETAQVVKERQ